MDLRDRSGIVQSGRIPKAPWADQATPLCIRNSGVKDEDNNFLVSGRFPSVLMYDIRTGLERWRSIYTGTESLSSMTAISSESIVAGGSYRGSFHHMDKAD
jgi:hypothetical protein